MTWLIPQTLATNTRVRAGIIGKPIFIVCKNNNWDKPVYCQINDRTALIQLNSNLSWFLHLKMYSYTLTLTEYCKRLPLIPESEI